MAVKQLQDVYSFRKTRLTCHKWKVDTAKLKGIDEANDPDKGIGKADDPNETDDFDEGVGEADDPNKVDDLDKGVGEADDPDVALLSLHVCIYKEISCTPRLVLIKKTSTRKGFRKIRS